MGLGRWQLTSLAAAALLGGYLLANAVGIFLGGVLPTASSAATLTGYLYGPAIHAGAVLWAFHDRRPARVWLVLLLASGLLTTVGMTAGAAT